MPSSPEDDLTKIESNVTKKLEELEAKLHKNERQPIAFGLNALIFTILWPDKRSLDIVEEEIAKIDNVQSAEIIDARRAVG